MSFEDTMERAIQQRDYALVSFDLETTGLDSRSDQIIEAALVISKPNGETEHVSTLIKPSCRIPLSSQLIHQITDEMVADAPTFPEVHQQFNSVMSSAVVIAHNAEIDLAFWHAECRRHQLPMLTSLAVIDTLLLSRNLFGFKVNTLLDLSKRFRLSHVNAHRALLDAHNTLFIFNEMIADVDRRFNTLHSPSQLNSRIEEHHRDGLQMGQKRAIIEECFRSSKLINIDYVSASPKGALTNNRNVTLDSVNWPWVSGYCHLRQKQRRFHIRRIFNPRNRSKPQISGD